MLKFTHSWEQRKLEDLTSIKSGFMGDSLLNDGKYKLTRIETISKGVIDIGRLGFSNIKPDDSFLLNKGDILYSNINSLPYIGNVAIFDLNKPIYHGINLLRLIPNERISSEYLFYSLTLNTSKSWAQCHANKAVSQASINQKSLMNLSLKVCGMVEQKKISCLFKTLDSLITLHQRKHNLLNNVAFY